MPAQSGDGDIPGGPKLSVALETENMVFETVFWLKRQNGKRETENNKLSAKTAKL